MIVRDFTMALACDGPSNGQYISKEQAEAEGYVSVLWPKVDPKRAKERVYVQASVLTEQDNEIEGEIEISAPDEATRRRYREGS